LLQELLEKKPDDEKLAARLEAARAKSSGGASAAAPAGGTGAPAASVLSPVQAFPEAPRREFDAPAEEEKAAQLAQVHVEPALDEETQKYIAQALTDVDLFSSYGLTQKATHLLESVLQKAPRHTPALERLLDMTLGAGDELRTAQLASQLEQIHLARGDQKNAERFAELRQRYQGAAAQSAAAQAAKPAAVVAPEAAAPPVAKPVEVAPAPVAAVPEAEIADFDLSIDEPVSAAPVEASAEAPALAEEEVDLSDEWESISQEAIDAAAKTVAPPPAAHVAPVEATPEDEAFFEIEEPAAGEVTGVVSAEAPMEAQAAVPQSPSVSEAIPVEAAEETVLFDEEVPATLEEAVHAAAPEATAEPVAAEEPVVLSEAASEAAPEAPVEPIEEPADEFEFDLVPAGSDSDAPIPPAPKSPMTADQFLSDLSAELGADSEPAPASTSGNSHGVTAPPLYQVPPHVPSAAPISALGSSVPMEAAAQASHQPATGAIATATLESGANLNELEEVFQEFRNELGEMNDEDEDLETHYNLGIAYREMGLADEAIGEFQKVAKAIQRGKPFRYAMQCATLLGLTFIDKGEPQIAALWYSRALETPGIDQETVLALRYDLGLAQEQAGDSKAALTSFRKCMR